jgi:hypothetical protein
MWVPPSGQTGVYVFGVGVRVGVGVGEGVGEGERLARGVAMAKRCIGCRMGTKLKHVSPLTE